MNYRSKTFNIRGDFTGWVYGKYHNYFDGSFYYVISNIDGYEYKEYYLSNEAYLCAEIGLVDVNENILYQNDKIRYKSKTDGYEYVSIVHSSMIGGLHILDRHLSSHLNLYDLALNDGDFEIIGTKWDDLNHQDRPKKIKINYNSIDAFLPF